MIFACDICAFPGLGFSVTIDSLKIDLFPTSRLLSVEFEPMENSLFEQQLKVYAFAIYVSFLVLHPMVRLPG